jgi:hypothetical protein
MSGRTRFAIYFLAGLLSTALLVASIALKKVDPGTTAIEINTEGRPHYKWYAPTLPSSIDFCGEPVPLDRWEVRERLDRELLVNNYLHGSQLYILKLTGRYFPIIEERLKANGVPEDMKYVCVAESSLQHTAVSSVGAASFWQFMKDTGPGYGLEINDEVDERFNIVKATDAACKYLKDAYAKFGSWTAAAASYNCGQGGYAKHSDFQGAKNYYDIILPEETNRYVFRILAFKHLLSNAKSFGLIIEPTEMYKPLKYRTVLVDKSIANLADFARENNTSYKMLKIYNPWLRAQKLTVKPGKTYEIQFPL